MIIQTHALPEKQCVPITWQTDAYAYVWTLVKLTGGARFRVAPNSMVGEAELTEPTKKELKSIIVPQAFVDTQKQHPYQYILYA